MSGNSNFMVIYKEKVYPQMLRFSQEDLEFPSTLAISFSNILKQHRFTSLKIRDNTFIPSHKFLTAIKDTECFNCNKISQYATTEEYNSCLGCVKTEHRKNAKHKRMEHSILNDIIYKLSKEYNGDFVKDYQVQFDVGLFGSNKRPDLQLFDKNTRRWIIVEIDEKQHFTKENMDKDLERIKFFRIEAKKNGQTLYVLRIIPDESKQNSMFCSKKDN